MAKSIKFTSSSSRHTGLGSGGHTGHILDPAGLDDPGIKGGASGG